MRYGDSAAVIVLIRIHLLVHIELLLQIWPRCHVYAHTAHNQMSIPHSY